MIFCLKMRICRGFKIKKSDIAYSPADVMAGDGAMFFRVLSRSSRASPDVNYWRRRRSRISRESRRNTRGLVPSSVDVFVLVFFSLFRRDPINSHQKRTSFIHHHSNRRGGVPSRISDVRINRFGTTGLRATSGTSADVYPSGTRSKRIV